MRIFYIGRFDHIWHEEQIARSFESLGHEVERCNATSSDAVRLIDRIDKFNPDFVLFAKLNIHGDKVEFMRTLKRKGIFTVCWVFDLYIGYERERYMKTMVYFNADMVFTTDGGHQKEFEEKGINHYLLRQGIYDKEAYIKKGDLKYGVIFVGTKNIVYEYRTKIMQRLQQTVELVWFGRDNSEEIRSHELNELYGQTKIVMGDSVYSDGYWSNRIYETLGRGGFLIHPMVRGLEKEFEPYKHFVPYERGDYGSLYKIIKYYLKNDDARDEIRLAGHEFCKKHYTYKIRCQELITQVNIGIKELRKA